MAINLSTDATTGQPETGKTSAIDLAGFPELIDVVEDLDELRYLIDDLQSSQQDHDQSMASSDAWLTTNLENAVRLLNQRHRRLVESMDHMRSAHSSGRVAAVEKVRNDCLSSKLAVRSAYRQRGTLNCLTDWQSPMYAWSMITGENRLTKGIAEHTLDYKRDGHLEAHAYENQFVSEYANHLGSEKLRGYLTNCGMAAFSSVLHWLVHEQKMTSAIAIEPMYFENLHLLQGAFPALIRFTGSSSSLLEILSERQPSVIFCDAITNCNEVLAHDFVTALRWAEKATKPVTIVLDTTCFPAPLLAHSLLKKLPDRVTVILIESLAKYHQFGMDTVTAGIVLMHAEEKQHDSLRKTRARHGSNIADASVGCLPRPNRHSFMQRMYRHSRNLRLLSEKLEATIGKDDAIESLSWLRQGAQQAPWFNGTCFSLHFKQQYRSVERYQEFEKLVMQKASERRLPLALSTSFGFDVSRLYVTAPSTVFEPPFLRISVGTEPGSQISQLASVLLEASRDCALRWTDSPTVIPVADPSHDIGAGCADSSITPQSKSLFAGADALNKYLSPKNFASPPLVELPADLNPYRADGVRIFAKIMPLVPLMNIKSIPAYSMLSEAAQRGELAGVENIIESSSSNTVLSLSVLSRLFGIEKTCAIVDHSLAPGLERMLRLFGIEIYQHPALGHELFGKLQPRSDRARSMGARPGWFNPDQYTNPDNPTGFAQWLAPDLLAQTNDRLQVFSCALGTCGTMVGVSRALRLHNPQLEVVASCPVKGEAVPGPRERALLADVEFDWKKVANAYYEISASESFASSIKLLRRGIMGGPSSGLNYAGLLRYIEQQKAQGLLHKDENGEVWCAFLCCDSPLPHIDEYFEALGEDYFPVVHPVPAQAVPKNGG